MRERIDLLLDPDTAWLELSPLAALGVYDDEAPGAGIVTGIGTVHGRECVIVANDATVKGGTYFPLTVKKHLRAQEIALENRLPCIYLVDSGGAYLPLQAEVFPDREHFGRIFYNQARMSAEGIPQLAAVMGSCTAGGAYVPAMCDQSVIVQGTGHDLPRRAAAREGGDGRGGDRRGARRRRRARPHLRRRRRARGIGRARAGPAARGGRRARQPGNAVARAGRAATSRRTTRSSSRASSRPTSARPFDVREVIARLVDGSRFAEFKPLYGDTLVCGFAHIWGYPVAILANNGILFSESALKGAHFVQLACQRKIPLVFLQNITGFMVGKAYEHGGIAKDGAKLVMAVVVRPGAEAHRRDRRLLRRRQLRHVRARLRAAPALHVAERAHLGDGRAPGGGDAPDRPPRRPARTRRATWTSASAPRSPSPSSSATSTRATRAYSTARLWDDGIVDPRDTRRVLALGLAAAAHAPIPEPRFGVFRM